MGDARFRAYPRARVAYLAGGAFVAMAASGCGQGADTGEGASVTASPPPVPTKNGLQAIWGSADDDVWAVGDAGTIVHFDGHAWRSVASGVTEDLTSVYGTGIDDVWVSGDAGSVLHWDGTAWKVASNSPDTIFLGVWASAANDVWAVGVDLAALPALGGSALVHHWNGTVWADSDVPGSDTLWKVWGSGPNDVWLVGTSDKGVGLIYRGDGTNFDPLVFTGASVHGIWGSGPDDVWVAPLTGSIQHWTGSEFIAAPALAADEAWHGISGSGPDDVWAVGNKGVIGHYVSGHWAVSPAPTTEVLLGVWSLTPNAAWLVGGNATALRWDGSGWK
jgi:hypothetical protein